VAYYSDTKSSTTCAENNNILSRKY